MTEIVPITNATEIPVQDNSDQNAQLKLNSLRFYYNQIKEQIQENKLTLNNSVFPNTLTNQADQFGEEKTIDSTPKGILKYFYQFNTFPESKISQVVGLNVLQFLMFCQPWNFQPKNFKLDLKNYNQFFDNYYLIQFHDSNNYEVARAQGYIDKQNSTIKETSNFTASKIKGHIQYQELFADDNSRYPGQFSVLTNQAIAFINSFRGREKNPQLIFNQLYNQFLDLEKQKWSDTARYQPIAEQQFRITRNKLLQLVIQDLNNDGSILQEGNTLLYITIYAAASNLQDYTELNYYSDNLEKSSSNRQTTLNHLFFLFVWVCVLTGRTYQTTNNDYDYVNFIGDCLAFYKCCYQANKYYIELLKEVQSQFFVFALNIYYQIQTDPNFNIFQSQIIVNNEYFRGQVMGHYQHCKFLIDQAYKKQIDAIKQLSLSCQLAFRYESLLKNDELYREQDKIYEFLNTRVSKVKNLLRPEYYNMLPMQFNNPLTNIMVPQIMFIEKLTRYKLYMPTMMGLNFTYKNPSEDFFNDNFYNSEYNYYFLQTYQMKLIQLNYIDNIYIMPPIELNLSIQKLFPNTRNQSSIANQQNDIVEAQIFIQQINTILDLFETKYQNLSSNADKIVQSTNYKYFEQLSRDKLLLIDFISYRMLYFSKKNAMSQIKTYFDSLIDIIEQPIPEKEPQIQKPLQETPIIVAPLDAQQAKTTEEIIKTYQIKIKEQEEKIEKMKNESNVLSYVSLAALVKYTQRFNQLFKCFQVINLQLSDQNLFVFNEYLFSQTTFDLFYKYLFPIISSLYSQQAMRQQQTLNTNIENNNFVYNLQYQNTQRQAQRPESLIEEELQQIFTDPLTALQQINQIILQQEQKISEELKLALEPSILQFSSVLQQIIQNNDLFITQLNQGVANIEALENKEQGLFQLRKIIADQQQLIKQFSEQNNPLALQLIQSNQNIVKSIYDEERSTVLNQIEQAQQKIYFQFQGYVKQESNQREILIGNLKQTSKCFNQILKSQYNFYKDIAGTKQLLIVESSFALQTQQFIQTWALSQPDKTKSKALQRIEVKDKIRLTLYKLNNFNRWSLVSQNIFTEEYAAEREFDLSKPFLKQVLDYARQNQIDPSQPDYALAAQSTKFIADQKQLLQNEFLNRLRQQETDNIKNLFAQLKQEIVAL